MPATPGIDCRAMLDTLGAQLNFSAIVDGVLGDWNRHFHCNWCSFPNFTILLFHSNTGTQVNKTTTADDMVVFLPVVDVALATCRKQVRFVCVQVYLDFSSLVTAGLQSVTVLRVEYYIKLPQGLGNMQNDNGGAYHLTILLSPGNLRTIPAADFSHDILATTLQDAPFNLLHPEFSLSSAKTDSTAIEAGISSKIIQLATLSILDHLFNQLCPGYSKEPHTALDHVWQTYEEASSNTIFSSVYDYYTQILATSRASMDQEILPASVFQANMDGLDTRLTAGFCTHFPNYSKLQERTTTHQHKLLQEMLHSALPAKTKYSKIRFIASEVNGFGG